MPDPEIIVLLFDWTVIVCVVLIRVRCPSIAAPLVVWSIGRANCTLTFLFYTDRHVLWIDVGKVAEKYAVLC